MIVRYICNFFSGALVERRILLCGLVVGAFVLTLALSSRHDDLWRFDAAPSTGAPAQPHELRARPTREAAPAAASAMNSAPAIAIPEPVLSEPSSTPDVDNGEMENGKMRNPRDRAAEHGSRSR
jgi:hypothetical protein